jgi:16S rRNA (cytosine1402-N4)-methyltransferase
MLEEVIEWLGEIEGKVIIDATLGGGGYSLAMSEKAGEDGLVLSLDADQKAIERVKQKIKDKNKYKIKFIHGNFRDISKLVQENLPPERSEGAYGIVFDLGLSSDQLADSSRGFSFLLDAPIDMRFDPTDDESVSTESIINKYGEEELFRIIRDWGEERFARRIARGIVESRKEEKIKTAKELANVIFKNVPPAARHSRIHPATRTFQALRLASNQELKALEMALPQTLDLLAPGGRLLTVAYHSLEDRIAKHFMRDQSKEGNLNLLHKRIIRPSEKEVIKNPRARSARLRVAEKI